MNTITKTELFTKTGSRATVHLVKGNSRYLFFQRCSLAPKKNVSADVLVQLLGDYFPGLVFIPKNSSGDMSVSNYCIHKYGKWALDIHSMSKSKEKIFSSLFPDKIFGWNEAEARKRYGCADVIHFFVDAENSRFSAGFSKLGKKTTNRGISIPRRFFDTLDYNGKPVWEDWDFSALVIHKMRRRPPSIYEAFGYYAHRHYTLMSFGLGLADNTEDKLLESGTRALNNTVQEQFPDTANFGIDLLTRFFEMVQETLESVPSGSSMYNPTELDVLLKQLKMKMVGLYKYSGDSGSSYSAADRKTINNHIEKAGKLVVGGEDLSELQKVKLSGTYREKINLLHHIVFSKSYPLSKGSYSQRELDIIHGLYLKQHKPLSLNMPLGGDNDDGDAITGYNLIGDEKYTSPEDHLAWSSFFRDEFAKELDENSLETFIACLPDHFSKYPFDINSEGDLCISKYSRKILFSTFCSVAGIFEDDALWKPFLVLLQRVISNINKSRL